jgi:hypothetical protein
MDSTIIAAIIASAGAVASALIAFIVSKRQVAMALDTARLQTQTLFLGKLYDKRLHVYPALYETLAELGDKIAYTGIDIDDLSTCWERVREWGKDNSLYLSPLSVTKMIYLRRLFYSFIKARDVAVSRNKQKAQILPALIDLQMSLKTELGILHADSFHNPRSAETLRAVVEKLST